MIPLIVSPFCCLFSIDMRKHSGQQINAAKSSIFFSKSVMETRRQAVVAALRMLTSVGEGN